ncbi:MAG: helix-turn-helix domain-containing protein [Eubacterium sp.]|nr:helix-turn-helix domain-containing protein [Eubacterium sp.]
MSTEDKTIQEKQKEIFAKKLNYYMTLNHKQQDDIINDLGINKSTISTWCRGIKMPRANSIQMLADYFNVNMTDFLDDKEYSNNTKLTKSQQELWDMVKDFDDDKARLVVRVLRSFLDESDQ